VLQSEYSLWSREPEAELLPACRSLGIQLMAYSPLGRGFLSGKIRSVEQLAPGDFRLSQPRFEAGNMRANLRAVDTLTQLARGRGATPSQLGLAWLLHQGSDVIPIPSTRSIGHFEENLQALDIKLTDKEADEIAHAVMGHLIHGERHPADHVATLNL
jgi:aryl-alcohol dehydrogenase-like predicted oxidoreductase